MVNQNSAVRKGNGSIDAKPATVVYFPPNGGGPRVGEATHHIVTEDSEVHVYLGSRSEGIDATLPLDRVEILRSERGRETFGVDVDARTGDGSESDSDGGSDPRADEETVVADGGCDLPPCPSCGSDLVESAEMETMTVGPRHGSAAVTDHPEGRCECGQSVGAAYGWDGIEALMQVLGDPRDNSDDDDSDSEIVTDGGQAVESGDVVKHDGTRHRVARVNRTCVEIYCLGSGSCIVPLESVTVVPDAVAADGGDR